MLWLLVRLSVSSASVSGTTLKVEGGGVFSSAQSIDRNTVVGVCNDACQPKITKIYVSSGGTSKIASIGDDTFTLFTNVAGIEFDWSSLGPLFSIGANAFKGLSKAVITTSIPPLTNIGADCFSGCSSLTQIELSNAIPVGANAFSGCSSLVTFTSPVVELDDCRSLIKDTGLSACPLRNLNLAKLKAIDSTLFSNIFTLEDIDISTVTDVPDNAFKDFVNLITFKNFKYVKTIGDYAFSNCRKLEYSDKLTSVTRIGSYAFQNCESLVYDGFYLNTNDIGEGAFCGCSRIVGFEFASHDVPAIAARVFQGCTSLSILYIYGYIIDDRGFPTGLQTIGDYAFENVPLPTAEFPNKITYIGNGAFMNC